MVSGTRELADLKRISDKNDLDVEKTHQQILSTEAKMKDLAAKGRMIEYDKLKKDLRVLQVTTNGVLLPECQRPSPQSPPFLFDFYCSPALFLHHLVP